MKIQIKRSDFFHLASQAYSLIEKRNVMPILSKAYLKAKKNRLYIQATDQDNSLESYVPAEVEETGEAVLDAQSLYDILKELPDGLVTLSGEEDKFKLEQQASLFHLLSVNVQDFPKFPSFNMDQSFSIKSEVLKLLIDKTVYCSSVDDIRYHLTGVFFELITSSSEEDSQSSKDNKTPYFRFVATDGHRLGLAEHSFGEDFSMEKGVIISRKGVQEIKKLLINAQSQEKVEVALNPARILFRLKNAVLSVKLVDGSYPDYQPFIPKSSAVLVEVDKEHFNQTLKRVSLLSHNRYKGVTFYVEDKKIRMEAESPDLGSAQDEVKVLSKKGQNLTIRFNARYVLEALSVIESQNVLLEFGGKNKACVFIPKESKGKKSLLQKSFGVVMPMRI